MNPKVPNDIQLSFNKKSWEKYFLCIQKIMNPPSLNFICFFRTTFPLFHDVQLFKKIFFCTVVDLNTVLQVYSKVFRLSIYI